MNKNSRLANIDFLRALSIIFVVFYHYRPFYGDIIFSMGHYGVLLFFMVSGYCIQFSAESSSSGFEFLKKRWIRLLPSLAAVSILIYIFKNLFTEYNLKDHYLISFSDVLGTIVNLPLINLPEKIINRFGAGYGYSLPDGAYWSLIIEFQFYFVISFIMILPKNIRIISQVLVVSLFTYFRISKVNFFYELSYFFPYFLIGISFANEELLKKIALLLSSVIRIIIMRSYEVYNSSIPFDLNATLIALFIFTFCVLFPKVFKKFGGFYTFVGIASYPLYLIHQHLGQKLLNYLGFYNDANLFKLFFVVVLFTFVSFLIHKLVETPLQKKLKKWIA